MIRRSVLLSAPVRLAALMLVLLFVATGCHRGTKGKNPDEGLPVEQLYDKSHKLMEGATGAVPRPVSAVWWPSTPTARTPSRR